MGPCRVLKTNGVRTAEKERLPSRAEERARRASSLEEPGAAADSASCLEQLTCGEIRQEAGKGKWNRVQHVTGQFTKSSFGERATSKADYSALRKRDKTETKENTLSEDLALKE